MLSEAPEIMFNKISVPINLHPSCLWHLYFKVLRLFKLRALVQRSSFDKARYSN